MRPESGLDLVGVTIDDVAMTLGCWQKSEGEGATREQTTQTLENWPLATHPRNG
jgi:hypothetical protein